MRTIEEFENCKDFNEKSRGYRKCYNAYCNSKFKELSLITFTDEIWEKDIPDILDTLRYVGESKFVYASRNTNWGSILHAFLENGCVASDVVELIYHTELYSGDNYINGVEITIN